MPTLPTDLRSQLEKVIVKAREISEIAAKSVLEALAVQHREAYKHMTPEQRELRNQLRARARQHGDRRLAKPDGSGNDHEIVHLISECAYEHWHRMLFARFLAENGLLIEAEENMAISLAEARELAKEDGVDVWVFASRCAQRMLPQIFRPEDPLLKVAFAPEHILKLETLLDSIPAPAFSASDSLGWVYQFWQSKRKDEINRSEAKISEDQISSVTQIFTEPYMVEFLLHNTLGAWWAGKRLTIHDWEKASSEDELRRKLSLPGVTWNYLRFVHGDDGKGGPWRPAAGIFDGWPKLARDIKVLDPCCGSGHFLVAALHHLVPIRMWEEGVSAQDAVDEVLRDNLHGLEIDERCCQIAAFALTLTAWKYPTAEGYRPLPGLHIACTGIAPRSSKEEWLRLGEEIAGKGGMPVKRDLYSIKDSLLSAPVKRTLDAIHDLFSQAPILGSLIHPANIHADLFHAEYKKVAPLISAVLEAQGTSDEIRERTIAATNMVKAAEILASQYTLIITNVPYLGRGKQNDVLKAHIDAHYPDGKADLATAFILRCLKFCMRKGSIALVTPQSWLFQTSYTKLRKELLHKSKWNIVARLGPNAFQDMNWWAATTALAILSHCEPELDHTMIGIDVSSDKQQTAKAQMLCGHLPADLSVMPQSMQLKNPDVRIQFAGTDAGATLAAFADSYQGIGTSDNAQFMLCHWELAGIPSDYRFVQVAPERTDTVSGATHILQWEEGTGRYYEHAMRLKSEGRLGGWKSGGEAWGKAGIAVKVTGAPTFSRYLGTMFDTTMAAIIPKRPEHLAAIDAFVRSKGYVELVRAADQAVSLTEHSFLKVSFDLESWQRAASEQFPYGLPEPESDYPTQWLFHGRPDKAQEGVNLQVAVARLLGYRWPAELDDEMQLSKRARKLAKSCDDLLKFADKDGIVCIPSVRGEEPAAERMLRLLVPCDIKPEGDLDDWLRNSFFEEHCKLFHDRPFVWHIWDGRKRDGFHALVNYHKLAEGNGKGRRLLENLTHSYLNDWISRQKDGEKRGVEGAEERLSAALELKKRLEAILEGEPPFDIFVRWKPLNQQALDWEPDINDGVRMNIRPFMALDLPNGKKGAGILRIKPNIKWEKDRGKEPQRPKADYPWFWKGNEFGGDRVNDVHLSNEEKRKARAKK